MCPAPTAAAPLRGAAVVSSFSPFVVATRVLVGCLFAVYDESMPMCLVNFFLWMQKKTERLQRERERERDPPATMKGKTHVRYHSAEHNNKV